MALHGDIRINNTLLGYWEARRLTDSMAGVNPYEWRVVFWRDDVETEVFGQLEHDYSAGAVALAGAVLRAAEAKAPALGMVGS